MRLDNHEARQAWRQFARARGAVRRDTEARRRTWGPWIFLACGAAFATWVYHWRSEQQRAVVAASAAITRATEGEHVPASAPGASPVSRVPTRGSVAAPPVVATTDMEPGGVAPRERPPAGPRQTPVPATAEPGPRASDRPGAATPVPRRTMPTPAEVQAPSPYVPRVREPPAGTSPEHAQALTKIPRARSDRAPIGGVGVHGIHVDRIVIGPRGEDGSCGAARRTVSQGTDGAVQVCFRVVHQRRAQRLLVHWVHDGALVRRTFLSVPGHRAYRTRAWMPLGGGDRPHGTWTAIVKTDDGIELASERFDVVP